MEKNIIKNTVGEIRMEKVVYTVAEIQKLLGVSKNKAYALVHKAWEEEAPFRVIKVGEEYRIPKRQFEKWLGIENGE